MTKAALVPISWCSHALVGGGALPQGSSPGWPCACHRCSPVREKLCAGWAEVQVVAQGLRAERSEMHQQCRDKLDESRGSSAFGYASNPSCQSIYNPDERQYYPIPTSLSVQASQASRCWQLFQTQGNPSTMSAFVRRRLPKRLRVGSGRRVVSWRIRAAGRRGEV